MGELSVGTIGGGSGEERASNLNRWQWHPADIAFGGKFANVWNVFQLTPDTFRKRSEYLDKLLLQANRQPSSVKRTLMVMVLCGRNETELKRRANFAYRNWVPELRDQPFEKLTEALDAMFNPLLNSVGASFCPLVGTPESIVGQMQAYANVGVEELMIQWWDVDDIEGLAMYAEHILSRL